MRLAKNIFKLPLLGILVIVCLLNIAAANHSKGFQLYAQKWFLSPDGEWVLIVGAKNARGHVKFTSSGGEIIDLPVWAYNRNNVIKIITETPMPLRITAVSGNGVRALNVPSPAVQYKTPMHVTITAVGPYLDAIGLSWVGTGLVEQYQIWRQEGDNPEKLITEIAGSEKFYQDDSVKPNTAYKYRVVAKTANKPIQEVMLSVKTPPALPAKNLDALSGKGLIVYIDPTDPHSQFYFKKLTPERIINYSNRLGVRYIQLRTVYGSYSHFTSKALIQWLSDLLEKAKDTKIAIIGWSIPRRDSTSAVAESIQLAGMRSPSGNAMAGSSLDLETGPDYMGRLPRAKEEMVKFAQTFRKATGPNYLISSIVFTPYKTGYTNDIYPYKDLAAVTDVLQPMVFWHHFYESAHHVYTSAYVKAEVANAITMLKQLAGKDIPVNVIGQSISLGSTGLPSAQEITYALQAAKTTLGLGLSFFAWSDALITDTTESPTATGIVNFQW